MNFTDKDLFQFSKKGIKLHDVEEQLEIFRSGIPFIHIKSPARVKRDIKVIDTKDIPGYMAKYRDVQRELDIMKFIPASGAASRMFETLFQFRYNPTLHKDEIQKLVDNLNRFAFYEDLKRVTQKNGMDLETLRHDNQRVKIVSLILDYHGLNYGDMPKGLLKFHRYNGATKTPLEEHLDESAHFAVQKEGQVKLHLTISKEYRDKFTHLANQVKTQYGKKYQIRYEVEFSEQKEYTDTIAVTPENKPFRLDNNEILFRPGGHGALLENLNALDTDYIFIKNIDNVTTIYREDTYKWKQILAGLLTEIRERVFGYIRRLEEEAPELSLIQEMFGFLEQKFSITPPRGINHAGTPEQIEYLKTILDRPIRVCGMVVNKGAPGGGPFLVAHEDGSTSLQIVEKSQIDLTNSRQKAHLQKSTHFNPVDIVCSVKNHQGKKFDLMKYRDPNTGFISSKTRSGRHLKALELPGLWNGSMAYWNTVFVEVPYTTFNPAKTVFDLLNEGHQ